MKKISFIILIAILCQVILAQKNALEVLLKVNDTLCNNKLSKVQLTLQIKNISDHSIYLINSKKIDGPFGLVIFQNEKYFSYEPKIKKRLIYSRYEYLKLDSNNSIELKQEIDFKKISSDTIIDNKIYPVLENKNYGQYEIKAVYGNPYKRKYKSKSIEHFESNTIKVQFKKND